MMKNKILYSMFVAFGAFSSACVSDVEGELEMEPDTVVLDAVDENCTDGEACARAASPPAPCTSSSEGGCDGRFTVTGSWKLPYYRNYALGTKNTHITRAVIAVHGMSRAAWTAFGSVTSAATDAQLRSTLIIAPEFQESGSSDELYWSSGGWMAGNRDSQGAKISSFAVVDSILKKLDDTGKFPNLSDVVIVGHSSGGQFVNRYAAGGEGENLFHGDVRYVIANPSSYMYLNKKRPNLSGSVSSFTDGDTLYTSAMTQKS